MSPFSYSGLQIVQDQKIEEALKRYHVSAESEMPKQGQEHPFRALLARFTSFSARKSGTTFPGRNRKAEGTAS